MARPSSRRWRTSEGFPIGGRHNVHNLFVDVGIAYLAQTDGSPNGFVIVDVTAPEAPRQLGHARVEGCADRWSVSVDVVPAAP